ncbi:hypothetical protein [Amycolatopsis sp. NPDC003676]
MQDRAAAERFRDLCAAGTHGLRVLREPANPYSPYCTALVPVCRAIDGSPRLRRLTTDPATTFPSAATRSRTVAAERLERGRRAAPHRRDDRSSSDDELRRLTHKPMTHPRRGILDGHAHDLASASDGYHCHIAMNLDATRPAGRTTNPVTTSAHK